MNLSQRTSTLLLPRPHFWKRKPHFSLFFVSVWICYGEINTKCDLYLQDCYSEWVCTFLYFWRVNCTTSDDKTERQRYPEQCFLLFFWWYCHFKKILFLFYGFLVVRKCVQTLCFPLSIVSARNIWSNIHFSLLRSHIQVVVTGFEHENWSRSAFFIRQMQVTLQGILSGF